MILPDRWDVLLNLYTKILRALKKKKMLFVAGGVGAAPVYPQVKWLHERGIDADVIVGAKTKDMLILEDEMKAVAGNYYPCTDDGTYGHAGMVTTMIEKLVERRQEIRRLCCNRTHDYDEICLPPDKEAGDSYYRQHESDHGGRNRNVRSLSSSGGR